MYNEIDPVKREAALFSSDWAIEAPRVSSTAKLRRKARMSALQGGITRR